MEKREPDIKCSYRVPVLSRLKAAEISAFNRAEKTASIKMCLDNQHNCYKVSVIFVILSACYSWEWIVADSGFFFT